MATLVQFAENDARNPRATIAPAAGDGTAMSDSMLRELAARHGMTDAASLEIERTLGQGGMGVVHLGAQRSLGRKVAVKSLRAEHRNHSTVNKLLREAWVTGTLEHPNVVPVYDIAMNPTVGPMIVLKRIEGVAWSVLMHDARTIEARFRARDPLEWNLRILMQVCDALRFAHSRGIIHRDIKPENVMIGEFGEVYVLDWGLGVTVRADADPRLPRAIEATELAGTPCYMAPEMLGNDAARLSERTDVYLLGSTLYEIVHARPPHEGATLMDIFQSVIRSTPEFPDDAAEELVRITRLAMDRDPDGRFENVSQFRLAIQGFLQHRGSTRLATDAHARLDALRTIVAVGRPDEAHRMEVYNLFGQCRFGFQEAIAAWEQNDGARAGLRETIALMSEYELARNDPHSAKLLIAGADAPPAELVERVNRAVIERTSADRNLEQMRRNLDPDIGWRTRAAIGIMLGTLWTVIPLVLIFLQRRMGPPTHLQGIALSGVLLAIAIALAVWARDTMTKTAINVRVLATIVFVLVAQIVLEAGALIAGITPGHAHTMLFFLWFCTSAMFTIQLEWRLVASTAGFLLAFLTVATRPDLMFLAMSGANLILTLNFAWLWLPRRLGLQVNTL